MIVSIVTADLQEKALIHTDEVSIQPNYASKLRTAIPASSRAIGIDLLEDYSSRETWP